MLEDKIVYLILKLSTLPSSPIYLYTWDLGPLTISYSPGWVCPEEAMIPWLSQCLPQRLTNLKLKVPVLREHRGESGSGR